ncbi:MAG: hypothetical protein JWL62_566 [Hyphomicrobiales bacterium]|nr:hypothetical protein [Hyphomicrobiales bacterium]
MSNRLNDEERDMLASELDRLRQEHRDLDAAIDALALVGKGDQLQLQRLKKRKLFLRDRLAFVEDMLTPDIIA